MMRSMFSAISGLRAHQTMMDVTGNNIANVSTAGYKSSQVTFQEALSQTLEAAGNGTNPEQVGLGVRVASISPNLTQGAAQVTGRNSDVMISGDGYFIVEKDGERLYTRAGAFTLDANGKLMAFDGHHVMGWTADTSGAVDTASPIGELSIPIGQVDPPVPTSEIEIGGNLSADAQIGEQVATSLLVYDSLGNQHELLVEFTKTGANTWGVTGAADGTTYTMTPSSLTFDTSGNLTSGSTLAFSGFTPAGADPMTVNVNLAGPSAIRQVGGATSAEAITQNGRAAGTLRTFAIAADGTISGHFSNGQTRVLGELALAAFANAAGLERVGGSMYSESVNSGIPLVGQAGSAGRGTLAGGALESSNVDLAQEFTNLIVAQRGFQANARVITSSDELLSDLVNLKR